MRSTKISSVFLTFKNLEFITLTLKGLHMQNESILYNESIKFSKGKVQKSINYFVLPE